MAATQRALCLGVVIALPLIAAAPHAQETAPASVVLVPTEHPRLPPDLSQMWLAPSQSAAVPAGALRDLGTAVKLIGAGNFTQALPILSKPAVQQGALGRYGQYYKGVAELRLARGADARRTFQTLTANVPVGYLAQAAALGEAEAAEMLDDEAAAVAIYERLSQKKNTAPEDILMRLGRAAKAAGEPEKARAAFARVYYEYPFSDLAPAAATELESGPTGDSLRYTLDLGRAERFFDARRYADARAAFVLLRASAQGADADHVNLRIAECDVYLKQTRQARDGLRGFAENPSLAGEGLYYYALAVRDLGGPSGKDEYVRLARRVVTEFPTSVWAEEALNSLATHYVREDDDAKGDQLFWELYEKSPTGRYAERAAWKIGWQAYRSGRYVETVRIFEKAAADFPRSDYRPPWLYWAGRAHDAMNEPALAQARYVLTATDYLNSYYGRLAANRISGQGTRVPTRRLTFDEPAAQSAAARRSPPASATSPQNESLVRALLGAGLYDQAIDELRYAQVTWGDSPPIQATLAWIYQKQAASESGPRRFALLRNAINTMRRAYPQFMAAGGEDLPKDLLTVIFPVAYWDLIQKHAAVHNLDPYFVAALVAQESTFVADIRSSAKAVGLMQLMPATARQYARQLKIRYSARLLTNPETNIQIGTAYLAAKIKEFGELHLALASYNAGERSVRRWTAERPGVMREEFIDDIPYPETQNYVKKILGMADDYRRIYGPQGLRADAGTIEIVLPGATQADTMPAASVRPPAKKPSTIPAAPARSKRRARKAA